MKKLISLMLALAMVFSMAIAASAAEVDYAASAPEKSAITLTKRYTGTEKVTEVLKFTSTPSTNNPDVNANLTIGDVTVDGTSATVAIDLPAFSAAGEYHFSVTEVSGSILGMDYSDTTVDVVVLVAYDNENMKYVVETKGVYADGEDAPKIDSYTNNLETASITVDKVVTGNMADQNDSFEIKVTVSVPATVAEGTVIDATINAFGTDTYVNDVTTYFFTKTITAADDAVTITGIPAGATVTVEETNVGEYTYVSTTGGNTDEGKTVSSIAADAEIDFVITNEKSTSVQTGIVTDSAPYIILIAVCAVAAVAFVVKRRNAAEF